MNSEWYVLQTKPQCEPLVERQLARALPGVYLPRIVANVRAGRYRQTRVQAMFPTYLFVEADLAEHGKTIRFTPGVRDFVRHVGAPAAIAGETVARMRDRIGPDGVFTPPPQSFSPGDRLRIEDGPMRGIDVVFERDLGASGRVAVLLAELELTARVVLPRESLSAA